MFNANTGLLIYIYIIYVICIRISRVFEVDPTHKLYPLFQSLAFGNFGA